MTGSIELFWRRFLATLPMGSAAAARGYEAWGFGDSPQMADKLGALVAAGIKTATCSLLWEYQFDDEPTPQIGEYHIILDGAGEPLCLIELTEVAICPYNEVDEEFAYAEGEGDRSLRYWQQAHWTFFSRVCNRIGRQIDPTMPSVCERFQLIYPGGASQS